MTFQVIPGLTYNGLPVGYEDTGTVVTPTPTPTPVPTPVVPSYVNPIPSRSVILTKMPWTPATRIYSRTKLDDHNIWLIPFTVGAFNSGSFAGGEWQDQPTSRYFQIIRNKDGVVVLDRSKASAQTPSFNFMAGVPPARSGIIQLVNGEAYTLAVWNAVTAFGSGQMFMELQYR